MMTRRDRFLSGSGFSFPGIVPLALTVAGSDSGGGAGIQADLKTFTAFGVFGTSAITAVTAQNTQGVTRVKALEPSLVTAQIDAVLEDIGAGAAKTGMLANAKVVHAVAKALEARGMTRLVVDPVMLAASGHRLLDPGAAQALKERLLPLALVVTPNVPEAVALTGKPIDSLSAMQRAARELAATGCRFAVVKGGHLPVELGAASAGELLERDALGLEGPVAIFEVAPPSSPAYPWGGGAGVPADEEEAQAPPWAPKAAPRSPGRFCIDIVYHDERFTLLISPHFKTRNTHGTGCTFSAAITAGLALGLEPLEAIVEAKRFITQAIVYSLEIGKGHGPTNHLLRFSPAPLATSSGGWSHEAAR